MHNTAPPALLFRVRISAPTPSSISSVLLLTSIMEKQGHECSIINIPDIKMYPLESDQPKPLKVKKMSGGMQFLRVALLVMRGRSQKPKAIHQVGQIDDGSKSRWRKILGSMRPLHLQSNQSPRFVSDSDTIFYSPKSPATDCGGNVSNFVAEEPYSPSPPSSRYASAVGLNELVQSDEENEKQEVIMEEGEEHVDGDGDEMIDSKAEDFITQFYQEMRLQRMDTVDRLYVERNQRLFLEVTCHKLENGITIDECESRDGEWDFSCGKLMVASHQMAFNNEERNGRRLANRARWISYVAGSIFD
ncbi:hypothetical protein VNO80_04483 [Phaseolus coccineus]|uniref:Uncharacterized protein n=1 Tax=Phaseolus coccineus TaxID=3886 RepID=A0AAN9NTW1_PHACN